MSWLEFAIVAAVAAGMRGILHRFVMKSQDPLSYAMFENILVGLALIPVMISEFAFPNEPVAWAILALSVAGWTALAIAVNYSYKLNEASLMEPVRQSRLFMALVLSSIFLAESITPLKIAGTMLIFGGLTAIGFQSGREKFNKGIVLVLVAAFLSAGLAIVDKSAVLYFTPGMFAFLVFIIPGLIMLPAVARRRPDAKKLLKTSGKYLLAVVILGAVAYYATLKAFQLGDASLAYPIIRMSSVITVIGAIAFLHEHKNLKSRIIATALAVTGGVLLSI